MCMPNLTALKLDQSSTKEEDETDQDVVSVMAEVIPSRLNLFLELQTIDRGIANCYKRARSIKSPNISFSEAMETLAEKVPALRSVHTEQAILLMVGCNNSGAFRSASGISCLDDVDVEATGMSFTHIRRG
ncbi:hypothetical protein BDV93DRAFT_529825 [Ceratobasidium sp. AG-I]|nr:hypothetical protein BDV93DRAFT_529825 [Ceratobasidium sp. AG-I]